MEFEKKVVELDVNDVLPNRFQPRIKFSEDSINELSESIKEHGVIQPIVVRTMGDKYEIIAGERRYKASLLAGKQSIPAIITDLNDKDSAEVALIENVQRQDLTPIEEAISYKKILDMGYLTQEELALKLGKNQSTVANKLRLLNLAEEVQEAVLEEKISERHARSLLKLQDHQQQLDMLAKIIENRLTVRKTDEEIAKIIKPSPVMIEKDDDFVIDFNPFDIKPLNNSKDKNIEKGLINMENEINSFMPTEPIIIEEPINKSIIKKEVPDEISINSEPSQAMNPGFMDVGKIEETAADINIEKPIADLNSLLIPTPGMEQGKIEEEKPIEKAEIPTGKFFNLPFAADDDANAFDPFAPLESKKVDVIPVTVTPKVSNLSKPIAMSSQDSLFNFNFDDVISTPAPSVPVETTPTSEIAPPVVETSTSAPAMVDNFELPTMEEVPAKEAPMEAIVLPDVSSMFPQSEISEQKVEVSSLLPEVTETPVKENNIASMVETPIVGEELPIPTLEATVNRNMIDAINVVRKCSKELESLGFIIDVEEIDFESIYQVILKIKK